MALTVRKTGLLNTAHLPDSLKPRKGKTLVVHVETPAWSYPPAHPDYTVLHCTGLGGCWEVRAQYLIEPPERSRPCANSTEKDFISEVRNLMIQHSLGAIEFSSHYGMLF
jgi:hypothetical protein